MPGDISNIGPNAPTKIAPIGPGGQKLPTIEHADPKMRVPVAFPILANLALLV